MWREGLGLFVLCVAAAEDMRKREIPVCVMIGAAALSAGILVADIAGGEDWRTVLLIGILSLIPGAVLVALGFLSRGGIGYGDGILALFVGPVFGCAAMAGGICLAFFFSALCSVVLLILHRVNRKSALPFVPFLVLGTGVVCYVSEYLLS